MSDAACSSSLVGRRVEWTADMRPTPETCMGYEEACWDMSLVVKRTGTIVSLSRSIFGAWKCLIETDGGFQSGSIEMDVRELRFIKTNSQAQPPKVG